MDTHVIIHLFTYLTSHSDISHHLVLTDGAHLLVLLLQEVLDDVFLGRVALLAAGREFCVLMVEI